MSVFLYQANQAQLEKSLLTARGLPSDSTSIIEAETGKFGIKRREPGILFISLLSSITLQTSKYDIIIDVCAN